MASRIVKFAPIGVVAGTMGYLCWPYVDDPVLPPAPKAKAAPVELTAAMLSPPAAPPLGRDPFGSAPPPAKPAEKLTRQRGKTPAPPQAAEQPVAAIARPAVIPAPSSLVLSGTYLRGGHHVAIINHAVYGEGETIAPPDPTLVDCRVVHVGVDKVMLDLNGQTAELTYPALLPSATTQEATLTSDKRPLTSLVDSNSDHPGTK